MRQFSWRKTDMLQWTKLLLIVAVVVALAAIAGYASQGAFNFTW
jgi:hypothetical protein